MEGNTEDSKDTKKKRKRICLTVGQKLEIIQQLDNGVKQTTLAALYNVSQPTISHVIRNQAQIIQWAEVLQQEHGTFAKKRCTQIEESTFDKIVFSWFVQNRAANAPLTSAILQDIAMQVNERLAWSPTFKASSGWLQKFKQRHGILPRFPKDEKVSPTQEDLQDKFYESVRTLIACEGYSADRVYNADETELLWRSLPNETLMQENNQFSSEKESEADKITVMTCANASGSHRLPLMIIGNSKKADCFRSINVLPINYLYQKDAWMNKESFISWYKDIFLPAIRSKMVNDSDKFLLIVDNAPCHASAEEMNALDSCCTVLFLPATLPSYIQPMHQGIVAALKLLYRTSYLREYIFIKKEINHEGDTGRKMWDLVNCSEKLVIAWDKISPKTFKKAWQNIFMDIDGVEEITDNGVDYLTNLMNQAFHPTVTTSKQISDWLDIDSSGPGWSMQSVSDLINSYLSPIEELNQEDLTIEDIKCEIIDDENIVLSPESDIPMSSAEALRSATNVCKWLRTRTDCDPDFLLQACQIKEFIAKVFTDDDVAEGH